MAAEVAHAHRVTLYHNPSCSNSRGVLALLRERGIEPHVIAYLDAPPDRATLIRLAHDSGLGLRGIARTKEARYLELGLDQAGDEALLDAMLAHPVLINRPIVVTPLGTRLCRPPDTVLDLLPSG